MSAFVESKEDEKQQNIASNYKVNLPPPDKKTLKSMDAKLKTLYDYKVKHEINKDGSCTFYPTPNCGASKYSHGNSSKISLKSVLTNNECKSAEAYSDPNKQVIGSDGAVCSFIGSSLAAWSNHYPFRFKCEHIWLLVLQAVAVHVDQNAEKLRSKFVKHDGKKKLEIVRDGFVLGSPHNDWEGVVEEFVEKIDKNTVADTVKLFECDFSSSTLTERIAAKITVMDIMKNYFEYCMWTTCCGFPQITLDGNKNDWVNLKNKCIKLLNEKVDRKLGGQWQVALIPLLDRFIAAFDGDINALFWNSMIKRGATYGSGASSWITGWFNILFPFTAHGGVNRFCVPFDFKNDYVEQGLQLETSFTSGYDTDNYGTGMASAPVVWMYLGKKLDLKFIAGFIGFVQDPKTFEICPNVDWCIAHAMSAEQIKAKKEAKKKRNAWEY